MITISILSGLLALAAAALAVTVTVVTTAEPMTEQEARDACLDGRPTP